MIYSVTYTPFHRKTTPMKWLSTVYLSKPVRLGSSELSVGKRRVVVEEIDKATQQKQRRMIKNRESAARSRDRKQVYYCLPYTVELESLVKQMEEENDRLLEEEEELNNERYKQLREDLIPVTEMRRPPRVLRRVHSMKW